MLNRLSLSGRWSAGWRLTSERPCSRRGTHRRRSAPGPVPFRKPRLAAPLVRFRPSASRSAAVPWGPEGLATARICRQVSRRVCRLPCRPGFLAGSRLALIRLTRSGAVLHGPWENCRGGSRRADPPRQACARAARPARPGIVLVGFRRRACTRRHPDIGGAAALNKAALGRLAAGFLVALGLGAGLLWPGALTELLRSPRSLVGTTITALARPCRRDRGGLAWCRGGRGRVRPSPSSRSIRAGPALAAGLGFASGFGFAVFIVQRRIEIRTRFLDQALRRAARAESALDLDNIALADIAQLERSEGDPDQAVDVEAEGASTFLISRFLPSRRPMVIQTL
jgi:hypothetical protein